MNCYIVASGHYHYYICSSSWHRQLVGCDVTHAATHTVCVAREPILVQPLACMRHVPTTITLNAKFAQNRRKKMQTSLEFQNYDLKFSPVRVQNVYISCLPVRDEFAGAFRYTALAGSFGSIDKYRWFVSGASKCRF